ncbi:MAG: LLM class flavin-dependent oxidoreductase [Alicyclobacillaceae bacterium]|nr:LLM class flavin-dependent oxidoreductase [Alicyclobacillaceae bacterium]
MDQPRSAPAPGKRLSDIPWSVLDLAPIVAGSSPSRALQNSLELARLAERLGYRRFWLAEHHNMPGIASSATAVVIARIAAGTSTIRVGSGGVMLPNHAPLVIAEQFGTLEALYPGRIDLGLGRAPGTDPVTVRALRRDLATHAERFPELLEELRSYLAPPAHPDQLRVRAIPGEGAALPIWLLGSSTYSAELAGRLGFPFAFASHFAPQDTLLALHVYRSHFQPSACLEAPYAMVCVNVIAADTDEEARRLSTSMLQQFLSLVRGRPGQLPPPVDDMSGLWSEFEEALVREKLRYTFVGGPASLQVQLQRMLDETGADEVMVHTQIFDHARRLRSYEILANDVIPLAARTA